MPDSDDDCCVIDAKAEELMKNMTVTEKRDFKFMLERQQSIVRNNPRTRHLKFAAAKQKEFE